MSSDVTRPVRAEVTGRTSAGPYRTPVLDLNLLSDERDRVRFRALMHHLRDVLRGPVFTNSTAVMVGERAADLLLLVRNQG